MVGMLTVGLGLLGASLVVLFFQDEAPDVLEGFGFGAALLAMFMRVGGGIFTKAADVGADLVGKVEQNIPEDDPRNAATIADNVGDNVGDCAGMAADLFESYAVTLVAALILGSQAFGDKGLVYPLLIPAIGALTAVAGVYLTKPKAGENGLTTINRSFYLSAGIAAVASVVLSLRLPADAASPTSATSGSSLDQISTAHARRQPGADRLGRRRHRHRDGRRHPGAHRLLHRHRVPARQGRRQDLAHRRRDRDPLRPLGRLRVRGLHDAGHRRRRLRRVPARRRGSLTVSLFAVALAGCGLLTTVGVIVAMDTFGPVSDNAQGIAEMSGDVEPRGRADPHRARRGRQHHQGDHQGHRDRHRRAGRDRAVRLLRHLGLRGARATPTPTRRRAAARLLRLQPGGPRRRAARLRPWCSSSPGLAINAVARAAGAVVYEVRRQFREIPGIMEGTGRPEYGKVVDIVTKDSLRELVTPASWRCWPRSRSASASASPRWPASSPARSAPAP